MKRFYSVSNKNIAWGVKKATFILIIMLLTIVGCCYASSVDKNWPIYLRTPEHNSATTEEINLPLKLKWKFFSDKIFNLEELSKFRFYERNAFSSPPITLDRKVFIRDNRGILYSISLDSGKLLWKRKGQNHCYLGSDIESKLIFSSLCRSDEIVVCALNADTGDIVWERSLNTKSGRSTRAGGSNVSITLDKSILIAAISYTAEGYDNIFRLNKNNGDIVWQQKVDNSVKTPPIIYNNRIIALSKWKPSMSPSEYSITVLSEDNGSVLLNKELGKIRDFPELSFTIMNSNILVKVKEAIMLILDLKTLETVNAKSFEDGTSIDTYTCEGGILYMKREGIVCYNTENDTIVWKTQFENWGTTVPLVTKKYVFVDRGSNIVAVNKETGKIEGVHNFDTYRSRFQVGSNGFERNYIPTSMIAVNKVLLVACGDGGLYAFEDAK